MTITMARREILKAVMRPHFSLWALALIITDATRELIPNSMLKAEDHSSGVSRSSRR